MKVLGIDPGTSLGWAVLDEHGGLIGSGLVKLSRQGRMEGAGVRYLRARQAILELLGEHEPGLVAYEEVRRHAGTSAAHVYGGIVGHLTALCESQGVPYTSVPVGQVKKRATGKGNASKAQMIEAAIIEWGVPVDDDNVADAMWIARTVQGREDFL